MMHNSGIGATDELSLRVSVATMVKVIFKHPVNGEWVLALERKATLRGNSVEVISQPFGGAIRIWDVDAIHNLIGEFRFDSERSLTEQDFRLFIRPSSWSVLREFCIQRLSLDNDTILETDPTRELTEEFDETVNISLQPNQYELRSTGMVLEDSPAPTDNYYASASPTVRVYRIFEAVIQDPLLISALLENSDGLSNSALQELALSDKHKGGNGWANAILTLPLQPLIEHYLSKPLQELNTPIHFEASLLDNTVTAILEEIPAPKYQRL